MLIRCFLIWNSHIPLGDQQRRVKEDIADKLLMCKFHSLRFSILRNIKLKTHQIDQSVCTNLEIENLPVFENPKMPCLAVVILCRNLNMSLVIEGRQNSWNRYLFFPAQRNTFSEEEDTCNMVVGITLLYLFYLSSKVPLLNVENILCKHCVNKMTCRNGLISRCQLQKRSRGILQLGIENFRR